MYNYKSCDIREKVCQTQEPGNRQCELVTRPCGSEKSQIKGPSSDKPKRLGYYINVIANMSKEIRISKSQMRLIVLDLEKKNIDDIVSMDKCRQEKLFIDTVRRYVNINENAVRVFLDAK
jgi:hypothetical protein